MISVCMASHNGGCYIRQQVESILKQIDSCDELIISDDSSADETLSILKSFNDSRIKIFNHTPPKGLSGHIYATINFENALKEAKGDYIFLSDQDDVWTDDKVEVMMKHLQYKPYVVSDCYVTDSDLNVVSNTRFTRESGITTNKYLGFLS